MPFFLRMYTNVTPMQPEPEPDYTLAALMAARTGDGDAFAALISPHVPRLQRLARRLTRSAEDAEDVCQESLLKAFTKLDQFAGTQVGRNEFRAWLMRITANCAFDFLRRKQPGRFIPLEQCDHIPNKSQEAERSAWGENPESSYSRQEQMTTVVGAITTLPAELRIVCLLRNLRELSTNETAAHLGISALAVRLRLFRAHGQLRKSLGISKRPRQSCRAPQNSRAAHARKPRYASRRQRDIEALRLRGIPFAETQPSALAPQPSLLV